MAGTGRVRVGSYWTFRRTDLTGTVLAPATVVTAEADPLRDEGEAYADRLAQAGIPVARRRFAGQVHPFVMLAGLVPAAVEAREWIGAQLVPLLPTLALRATHRLRSPAPGVDR